QGRRQAAGGSSPSRDERGQRGRPGPRVQPAAGRTPSFRNNNDVKPQGVDKCPGTSNSTMALLSHLKAGLERWVSGEEQALILQRAGVQSPASISGSHRELDALFRPPQAPAYIRKNNPSPHTKIKSD
ncbi:mCG145999, partial [Mus musculus]